MRILVVDDDYVSRTKLKALLDAYGDCDGAPGGQLGIELFRKAHEETVPYQLITMDLKMPGKGGREVLQEIRKWEDEHGCFNAGTVAKILMVTVMTDRESIMSSFRENCDAYLIKPFTPSSLKEELGKLGIQPLS